jgi:hypothetical protein
MKSQKPVIEYTNSELYQVLNHIDQKKYPERVSDIEKEIERRLSAGEVPKELVPELIWDDVDFKKPAQQFLGVVILSTFILSLFQLIELSLSESVPLVFASLLSSLSLLFGSIFLMINRPKLGMVALPSYLLQAFSLQLNGFQLDWNAGLSIELSFGSNGIGFGASFGVHQSILQFESINHMEFGINVYALFMLFLLFSIFKQKKHIQEFE